MPLAARFQDLSSHGGHVLIAPVLKVMIEGKPAAVLTTQHVCVIPTPPAVPHPPTPFTKGSSKISIKGQPAVSTADSCGCGAIVVSGVGARKVFYNG